MSLRNVHHLISLGSYRLGLSLGTLATCACDRWPGSVRFLSFGIFRFRPLGICCWWPFASEIDCILSLAILVYRF